MATHDRLMLDRALEAFASVKAEFEAQHGPLPGPGEHGRRRAADSDA
jgi:8-amino-7-oxononanoate synthase